MHHTRRTVLAAGAALLAGRALPASAQGGQAPRPFRAGTSMAEEHPAARFLRRFAELTEQRSGGRLRTNVHTGAALGADVQMQSQLQAGTQDVVTTGTATLAGQVKEMAILDFPFLFETGEEFDRAVDGPLVSGLNAKLRDKGWIPLAYMHNGFRHTTNGQRPIQRAEDFAGLKIRVIQSAMYTDMFRALGANPVPMAVSEVYSALETGAVDAQENPLAQIATLRFFEVQKYLSLTGHIYVPAVIVMSKAAYDRLSEADRQAFVEAARLAGQNGRADNDELEAAGVANLLGVGMQINADVDKTAFRTVLASAYAKWHEQFGDLIDRIQAYQ